ncbi:MAG: GMC family oxidoreductase [Chromatiales bacterium]|nr:GMC family oxidoreductase [Chromatiales bacterium]
MVVVGSGFGGAVLACRLAEAGRRVLVLERGREWHPDSYPRDAADAWVWDQRAPHRCSGWVDLRVFRGMTVVQGAGVGGGSLIYANVFVEAEPWVFERGWPRSITHETLAPHYETTGRMLAAQTLPAGQLTPRTELMREGAAAIGAAERFRLLPLAVTFDPGWHAGLDDPTGEHHSRPFVNAHGARQGTCVHCGNCDIGCRVQAKNTLDLNYLALARRHGAEIRPLHMVRRLTPLDRGYRLDFDRIVPEETRAVPGAVEADRVVLAAGSLGSTELLLRARDEHRTLTRLSPRLGHRWCSNGDFLTPAIYRDRTLSPTRGPTISAAIDFLDGARGGHRFFVEDGGFPNLFGNGIEALARRASGVGGMLAALLGGLARHARADDPLDCVMPWFGQAADESDGRLRLGQRWWWPFGAPELRLDWDVARSLPTVQALVDAHLELSRATGGDAVEPAYWKWGKDLVTPHPLGGCAMADDPAHGVVDAAGEVFGHPGLHVADGAIVPRSIGLNPSRTIAALAEHIAARMVA